LQQGAIHFDIDGRAAPADQTGENALAALQFLKDWEREGDFAVSADEGKLHEAFRGPDGEFAEEQGVNQGEYSGIGADSQRKREYGNSGETEVLAKDPGGVTQILPELPHSDLLPESGAQNSS
jgi:hypothetical protein